jgi:hypothetical protein
LIQFQPSTHDGIKLKKQPKVFQTSFRMILYVEFSEIVSAVSANQRAAALAIAVGGMYGKSRYQRHV